MADGEIGGRPPKELTEILEEDEGLLRAGRFAARCRTVRTTAISVGLGLWDPRGLEVAARRAGLPILRRSSGGTALLHLPGDLAWSVVLPRDHPDARRGFTERYARLGGGVVAALRRIGIRSEWSAPIARSERFCLLGPRGHVLTAGGRAIGGAAQHLTARALLHHGTVGRRVDRPLLAELFELAEEELERSVTSIEEIAPEVAGDDLSDGIERELGELERVAGR